MRDEGIPCYPCYREPSAAGVQVIGCTVLGASHGADPFFDVLAEVCEQTMHSLVGFTNSL